MFRSFAKDVVFARSIALRPIRPASPVFSRFLSSQSSSTTSSTSSTSPPHIPSQNLSNRKPKIDLRPAPVKPKSSTLSAFHSPRKPTQTLSPPTSESSPTPSLSDVKETTKRDIEDAEVHGILSPPPPDANWFKRTLHTAIQLAKFYFAGVKLIFIRRKEISLIRARIKSGGSPLSRSEYRLIRTQKDDVNKVIPFVFIALLLEEVIPLIAIYAPFMLPSTCILPSQRARIEAKKTEKAIAFANKYRPLFAHIKMKEGPTGHLSIQSLKESEALFALCGILRLSTLGFDGLRIRRIRRHLEFLAVDDRLLLQDGLLGRLSEKDLNEALEERGIITQGLAVKTKESRLQWWLDSVGKSSSITHRLLLLVTRH